VLVKRSQLGGGLGVHILVYILVTTRFASIGSLSALEPLWEDGETKKKVLDAYIKIACMSNIAE